MLLAENRKEFNMKIENDHKLKEEVVCSRCSGSGSGGFYKVCEKCLGTGYVDWVGNVVGKNYSKVSEVNGEENANIKKM